MLALCAAPRSTHAQAPPLTPQFLNEHCIVSVLNRNVRVNPEGTWRQHIDVALAAKSASPKPQY